jgi:hypothetical protein
MKAICPISGVPFRTYDSLPLYFAVPHPIFHVPFESLVTVLEDIRAQEEHEIKTFNPETQKQKDELNVILNSQKLANLALEAIHEKNWRNPAFKLYQTKHLVMLAFMKMADLLEVESGYCARPSPQIIEAYFWRAAELFVWAGTISSPFMKEMLPKYRVSAQNEGLDNFVEYLEILEETKNSIGMRYRSTSEERKLEALEKAITILSRRREILHKDLTNTTNTIAAKWALTMTRAPKDIHEFWYQILASSSMKITFEGVQVNGKWEIVTEGDLRELRDFLEDNLIGPKGEHKEYHRDDSEYYFTARSVVLNIVRRHIAILEQGTSSYKIVNVALGDAILNSSDDVLAKRAIEADLPGMPKFSDYVGQSRIIFIKAMARWRHSTKTALLDIANAVLPETTEKDKKDASFKIL